MKFKEAFDLSLPLANLKSPMKKILLSLVLIICCGLLPNTTSAQTTTSFSAPLIWATSPFQDSLWATDTTNWQVVRRVGPTLPGFTILGMTGLALDPTTGISYVIMKLSAVTGRVLGTIDLNTGVCSQVGNLGAKFASICFDETGQLWGATGDGANPSESLFKIDKNTGTTTLMFAMGNGADGEAICYNRHDNNMYHWSGNGTLVMEKWAIGNPTYTPANIPVTGTTGGETFGVMLNSPTSFIISNISSSFKRLSSTGTYEANLTSNPDDLRGIIMLPYFTTPITTVCERSPLTISAGGHQLYDQMYFHWGDGNSDSLTVVNGQMLDGVHTYTTAGTYTATVETYNGFGGDTVYTVTVTVNPTPMVTITGFAAICGGDPTNVIAITSPGTYQWYENGFLAGGETDTSYLIFSPGNYNLITTNSFGCSDSAAVGLTVVASNYPVLALNDTTTCGSFTADAGNVGSSYMWSTGDTTQMSTIASSMSVSVTVTNVDGCASTDNANITINPLPVVNLGPDVTVCGSYLADAGPSLFTTFLWCDGSTTQTALFLSSGQCAVVVTDTNGCSGTDTIGFTINPLPVVNLGPDVTACGSYLADAGPSLFTTFLWCDGSTTQTALFLSSGQCAVVVTDTNGCSGTDTIGFTINPYPTVTLGAMNDSVCISANVQPLFGGPVGGTYSGPGTTSQNFNPAVAGSGVHTIVYMYTDMNGCTSSDTLIMSVFGNPVVTVSSAPSTVCADDADVALTGSPVGGNFTGTSVTGSSFDPSIGAGNYNIIYTFTDVIGCSASDTTAIAVNACVGIEENTITGFTLYPNPTTGVLNFTLTENSTIEVFDVLGNTVESKQFNTGSVQVDLSNQPNGVYFVRVNGTNAQRVVIQK
jgi:hypothetical protein